MCHHFKVLRLNFKHFCKNSNENKEINCDDLPKGNV